MSHVDRRTQIYGETVLRLANGLAPKGVVQAKLVERAGLTSPEAIEEAYEALLTPLPLLEAVRGSGRQTLHVRAVAGRGAYLSTSSGGRAEMWVSLASIRDAHPSWRLRLVDPDGLLPEDLQVSSL